MQDFRLDTVKTTAYVNIEKNHIWVVFSDGDLANQKSYSLSFSHYDKLKSYKSVSALVKYAKAHALLAPNTATDLPSVSVAVAGNPPPVTVSAPTTSDTPIFISVKSTGHGKDDEIIDLAIVDFNEKILFESLFKTKTPNRVFANDDLVEIANFAKKPTFDVLWDKVQKVIKGNTLVAYHLPHVKNMLVNSVRIHFQHEKTLTFDDVLPRQHTKALMYDYAKFWGDYAMTGLPKNQSLEAACMQQSIKISDLDEDRALKRAVGDAIKTARLYKHLNGLGVAA